MLAINKSYLDLILNENETGGAMPNYGDIQGKVVYNINDNNKISVIDLTSIDNINLKYENAIETNVTNVYGKTNGLQTRQELIGNISGIKTDTLKLHYHILIQNTIVNIMKLNQEIF